MPRLVSPAERELTPVQRAILDFVLDYTRRSRYSPSYLKIGDAVRLKSSSAVSYQLGVLETMGHLSRQPGRPRSIVVTALYRRDASAASAGDHDDDVACVPLVGRIAAGGPILAFEDIEENLPLPRSFVGHGDLIALRVRGDSMIGSTGYTTATTGSCRATLPTRLSLGTTPRLSERLRPSCVAASDEVPRSGI